MQNTITKPAKPARNITTPDAKAANKPAPADAAAPAEKLHTQHAVSRAHYAGLSSYINADRKTEIPVGNTKYGKRTSFTPRMHGAIVAMRNAYGNKPFPARGFDNAQIAIFINNAVCTYTGGKRNGDYLHDAPGNPVMLQLAPPYAVDPTKAAK